MVTVDDHNIGIAEVAVVPVDKLIVSSGNSVRADAVAGEDGILPSGILRRRGHCGLPGADPLSWAQS